MDRKDPTRLVYNGATGKFKLKEFCRILLNRRPVKSPLEKVRSNFFFSKNEFLWVLPLSHKNFGSSLDHLAAVFYSQKTQDCVIRSLGSKPGKKTGKLTTP